MLWYQSHGHTVLQSIGTAYVWYPTYCLSTSCLATDYFKLYAR